MRKTSLPAALCVAVLLAAALAGCATPSYVAVDGGRSDLAPTSR